MQILLIAFGVVVRYPIQFISKDTFKIGTAHTYVYGIGFAHTYAYNYVPTGTIKVQSDVRAGAERDVVQLNNIAIDG